MFRNLIYNFDKFLRGYSYTKFIISIASAFSLIRLILFKVWGCFELTFQMDGKFVIYFNSMKNFR